ncbi:hypothetical protein ACWERV_28535 [Streptomyces sp. NPDC004031]
MFVPVGKSTQSGHFKVLREAGVISRRDEGTRRVNRLRREDLAVRQGREASSGT